MSEIARQTVIVEWDADYSSFEAALNKGNVRFQASQKEIAAGLTKMSADAKKAGKEFDKGLEPAEQAMDDLAEKTDQTAKTTGGLFSKLKSGLGEVGKAAAGMFLALGATEVARGIVTFFQQSSQAAGDFETSLSNLSAITGATGQDLAFYEEQAKLIGSTTTKSATEAVEAFKLIGSAKPDLLANKEALAAVTREAVTLAEASGLTLPEAATALTGALNQFSLPAEEAGRIINVLAAGAKAGAAEIPETQAALEGFGVAASNAGISVEESVGAIQLLAEFGIKGAEAGTALRNVLSRLSAVDALPKEALDQLEKFGVDLAVVRDETLPTEERLRELGKISGDASAIVKVFGLENQVAGQIVLGNVDKFAAYTDAVTGTQDALDQAKVNTDNFQSAQQRLANAFNGLQIAIGETLNNALAPLVQGITTLILGLTNLPKFIQENQVAIKGIAAGLLIWNSQLILASANSLRVAAAQRIQQLSTVATTIAQQGLNAAMTANPVGLVIKAISLLVAGFAIAYNKSETFRAAISGLGAVAAEVFQIVKESLSGFVEGFKDIAEGNVVQGLKKIGTAFINTNPIGLALTQGKRLGNAFKKGFDESKAKDAAKDAAETTTDLGGATQNLTKQVDALTQATNANTGATNTNNKAQQKQLTALGELGRRIQEETAKLEDLTPGTEAFDKQAALIRGLVEQSKIWKQAVEDALNPPTELQLLERAVKNLEDELAKATPGSTLFDALKVQLKQAEDALELYKQRYENAINPPIPPRIESGRLSNLKRQLTTLEEAYKKAALDGNADAGRELLDQINQIKAFIQAQLVIEGDPQAIQKKIDEFTEGLNKTAEVTVTTTTKEDPNQEPPETTFEDLKRAADDALGSLNEIAARQVEVYQEAVGRQTERIERFKELARTGSSEQLAIEEERLAKLTELQEKAAARQRRIAEAQLLINQAVTVSESVKAIAQAFGQGGALGIITGIATSAALALTLAQMASSVNGLFGSLPQFRTGSEFIEGPGSGTSDSILARVSRGERIVPYEQNREIARIGGIPNKKLPEAVAAWKSGPVIIEAIREGNENMIREMQEVRRELMLSRLDAQKTRVNILATRKGLAAMVSEQTYMDKFSKR